MTGQEIGPLFNSPDGPDWEWLQRCYETWTRMPYGPELGDLIDAADEFVTDLRKLRDA